MIAQSRVASYTAGIQVMLYDPLSSHSALRRETLRRSI